MEAQKSAWEETQQLLAQRVSFFTSRQLSAENILNQPSNYSVRSLSEIVPQMCVVDLKQTPLHSDLADIYLGRQAYQSPLEDAEFKFLLPPVSEGEDSITEDDDFEPTFKWVSNSIIDSNFLLTDKIEPKKVEKRKVPPQWKGIFELVIFNIERKIYLRTEMLAFEEALKNRFEKFPWIKFKKVKEMYYRGKPSILLRFHDEADCSFVYFNLSTILQKDLLGHGCQILRVTENKLKEKLASDVTLVFRRLPSSMTRDSLLGLFKRVTPTWAEELVEINGFKYTICKVNYLEDAFHIITSFKGRAIKEAKVNCHPKSAKKWRAAEQRIFEEGEKE